MNETENPGAELRVPTDQPKHRRKCGFLSQISLLFAAGIFYVEYHLAFLGVFPATAIEIWLPIVFLPAGLVVFAFRRLRNLRIAALVVTALIGTLLAIHAEDVAAPSVSAIKREFDRIELPDQLRQVDEMSWSGTCFDVCPAVWRDFVYTGDPEQVARELYASFDRAGFSVDHYSDEEPWSWDENRDSWEFSADLDKPSIDVYVEVSDELVEIQIDGNEGG